MKVVIQRSKQSSVKVDDKLVSKIDKGLVILVCFTQEDTLKDIEYITKKIINLRIFDDENKVMNKSILDTSGSILCISQFTLYANTKKGNRPSYQMALNNEPAKELYDEFCTKLNAIVPTFKGVFGADMQLNILNDGPITIIIDSKEK